MKALISPDEKVFSSTGELLGERVAQVDPVGFEIAPPMFWVDCSDDVVADRFYYDPNTESILPVPVPAAAPQPVSTGAQEL